MRVQATRQGQYNQYLVEPGEVFDLLDNPDGSVPLKMVRTYGKTEDGKIDFDNYTEEVWTDAEGNPRHRDFAPDFEELKGKGAFRGEAYAPGWMVQVPDDTPLGIYEPGTRFDLNRGQAVPIQRVIKPSNEPMNMPSVAPMRGRVDRTRRAAQ